MRLQILLRPSRLLTWVYLSVAASLLVPTSSSSTAQNSLSYNITSETSPPGTPGMVKDNHTFRQSMRYRRKRSNDDLEETWKRTPAPSLDFRVNTPAVIHRTNFFSFHVFRGMGVQSEKLRQFLQSLLIECTKHAGNELVPFFYSIRLPELGLTFKSNTYTLIQLSYADLFQEVEFLLQMVGPSGGLLADGTPNLRTTPIPYGNIYDYAGIMCGWFIVVSEES